MPKKKTVNKTRKANAQVSKNRKAQTTSKRDNVAKFEQVVVAKRKKTSKIIVVASLFAVFAMIATGAFAAAQLPEKEKPETLDTTKVADKSVAEGRIWEATISTNQGDIKVTLDGENAPQAVANFITLAKTDFLASTGCPRVTTSESFALLQCGAPIDDAHPNGDQSGGPGFKWGPIENSPSDDVYPAGTLAMARESGNGDSNGSQFFIVDKDSQIPADEAGGYTVFGQVTSGLDLLDEIINAGTEDGSTDGAPKDQVKITKVTVK